MISKHIQKEFRKLDLGKIDIGTKNTYIKFKNSKSMVRINNSSGELYCDCYFSSNHNKTNEKLCKHKCKIIYEIMKEKNKNG